MGLVGTIDELLRETRIISQKELDELISQPSFKKYKRDVVRHIIENMDYPSLNALIFAYRIPDKRYERKLLKYTSGDMTDNQAVYWMLALGEIGSAMGFEKIKQYAGTHLSHQAFVAMAKIDICKTLNAFEAAAGKNKEGSYEQRVNTLATILESYEGDPRKLIAKYLASRNKPTRNLFSDALSCVRKKTY